VEGVLWLTRIRKKDSRPACPDPVGEEHGHQGSRYRVAIKNLKLCNFAGSYVAGKSCGQEYACYIPS
jgi:hypothetical protein